jgi:tRNA(Ile2) C34 agmatinyltransferase TiaS
MGPIEFLGVLGGIVSVIVAVMAAIRLLGRGPTPPWELENEANARFLPSSDPHDPRCPRCRGRGRLAGLAGKECPVCQGRRHVRFGPET